MDKPDILRTAARPFGFAAAAVLVFMMLFTTAAVVMRQLFNAPILGVVDVMELAFVACIFVAMPGVIFRDQNITIDVIDHVVPRGVRVALRYAGMIVTLGFLLLLLTEMIGPALDKLDDGEVTMTLGISRFVHWLPILFGFAMSSVAAVCVLVGYVRRGVPADPVIDPVDE